MDFKQELLKDIVYTYKDAERLNIYEDRVKHTKGFRDFFFQFNEDLMRAQNQASRRPITTEVIQVPENATQLDPVAEIAFRGLLSEAQKVAFAVLILGPEVMRRHPASKLSSATARRPRMIIKPLGRHTDLEMTPS
jgi:hypothetical protein